MSIVEPLARKGRAQIMPVCFDRVELDKILNIYGFFVAAGDWKDYAIGHLGEYAVFSIFRKTAEAPLYRIEKHPRLTKKQGAYCIISAGGQVLKRGNDLTLLLKYFDRQKLKIAK
ncbi:MAG: DUF2794 domain-containing protein [bacterium]